MFVLLVESYYLWIAISETVETWVHEENVLTTDRLVLKRSTYLAHASRYRWAAEMIGLLSIEWKQTSPSRRQDQSISISIVQYSTSTAQLRRYYSSLRRKAVEVLEARPVH